MRLCKALLLFLWIALASRATCALDSGNPASVCKDWRAWRTQPSTGSAILHVTARCELPTPGHKVELVPADPQGTQASVLVLNEILHAPEGMVTQVITPYELHYRKSGQTKYQEVVINPDGTHVPVGKTQKQVAESPAPVK